MNRLQEIEKRLAEIKVELENDNADIDALEKEVKELTEERKAIQEKIERRKEIMANIVSGEGTIITDFIPNKEERKFENMTKEEILETPEYRSAFLKRLLGKPLTEAEERAYTSADNSAGAVIPTLTASELFDKMVAIAPMIDEITLLRVAGNVKFAIENVRDAATKHTENAAVTPAGDSLAYVTLAGYEYIKVIRISKTVQTMSINAFENWLTDMLAEDIAVAIENDIINGDGVSGPKGVEYAATWVAGENLIEYANGGSPSYDNVMDMIAALPLRYHSGAKFLCNSKFLYGKLAKIKDDQKQPILVKDMANGLQFRIMGFPVLLSDKVADGVMYFGNFKKIVGNLAQDVTVESSTQSGFLNNSIDFRGTAIFDCDIALPDAFIKMAEAGA
jgi:HK97 family phage major capsid protein